MTNPVAEAVAALARVRLLVDMWAADDSPGYEMRVQHAVESLRDALRATDEDMAHGDH